MKLQYQIERTSGEKQTGKYLYRPLACFIREEGARYLPKQHGDEGQ